MKRFGDFWIPDVDARLNWHWLKSRRLYTRGRGPKIADLEQALSYCKRWTVALDGGANVGAYSRVLMDRFEKVHAFAVETGRSPPKPCPTGSRHGSARANARSSSVLPSAGLPIRN